MLVHSGPAAGRGETPGIGSGAFFLAGAGAEFSHPHIVALINGLPHATKEASFHPVTFNPSDRFSDKIQAFQ